MPGAEPDETVASTESTESTGPGGTTLRRVAIDLHRDRYLSRYEVIDADGGFIGWVARRRVVRGGAHDGRTMARSPWRALVPLRDAADDSIGLHDYTEHTVWFSDRRSAVGALVALVDEAAQGAS